MEFIAGVLVTLIVLFIGRKVQQAIARRKVRATYIPPQNSGLDRPVKDYPKHRKTP